MDFENFIIDGDSDAKKTKKAVGAWKYVKEASPTKYNKITLQKGKTSLLQSKICGAPYCPKGFEIPKTNIQNCEEREMRLLAQINFEEMPRLENFPEKGILQFYISCQGDDDSYGCNFDDMVDGGGFKVIFHENPNEADNTECEQKEFDEGSFPTEDECSMKFEQQTQTLTFCDYRFEEMFLRKYNEGEGEPLFDIFDLPDDIYNKILDESSGTGHKIGGYPFFTQQDPREFDNEYNNYNVLLLQIDSDEDNGICWGDCGVANFFISFDDLKKRDFSKVMYSWDCC